jgi:uroporphyrinogen-III decarboxylase
MEVATRFCLGSPAEVREEVRRSLELCRHRAAIAFFTSNTITPDIPLENIRAYWEAVQSASW